MFLPAGVLELIAYILLILSFTFLSIISTGNASAEYLVFGFVIECAFIAEIAVKYLAMGSSFFKKVGT
jgi:hypothetical protein